MRQAQTNLCQSQNLERSLVHLYLRASPPPCPPPSPHLPVFPPSPAPTPTWSNQTRESATSPQSGCSRRRRGRRRRRADKCFIGVQATLLRPDPDQSPRSALQPILPCLSNQSRRKSPHSQGQKRWGRRRGLWGGEGRRSPPARPPPASSPRRAGSQGCERTVRLQSTKVPPLWLHRARDFFPGLKLYPVVLTAPSTPGCRTPPDAPTSPSDQLEVQIWLCCRNRLTGVGGQVDCPPSSSSRRRRWHTRHSTSKCSFIVIRPAHTFPSHLLQTLTVLFSCERFRYLDLAIPLQRIDLLPISFQVNKKPTVLELAVTYFFQNLASYFGTVGENEEPRENKLWIDIFNTVWITVRCVPNLLL